MHDDEQQIYAELSGDEEPQEEIYDDGEGKSQPKSNWLALFCFCNWILLECEWVVDPDITLLFYTDLGPSG